MPILFGEPRRPSELGRQVPKRVDLFEVRVDPKLPKPAKLQVLAKERPKLQFSVVAGDAVFGPDAPAALALTQAIADALRARYLVVRAPASLRPGPSSEKRVAEVLSALSRPGTQLVFEPSGLWQRPRVRALAAEANALFSQRLDELEPVASLYLRIVQLGTGRALLGRKLEALAAVVQGCSDACIVVEGGSVAAVRTRLDAELEFAAESEAFDLETADDESEDDEESGDGATDEDEDDLCDEESDEDEDDLSDEESDEDEEDDLSDEEER